MPEKEYIIDDRWELPDEIRNMSKEELKQKIAQLEKEIIDNKRIAQNRV